MTRRKIREEIFKLLFEHELIDNDIQKRIEEVIEEEKITKEDQIDFLKSYVTEIIENEEILIEKIKNYKLKRKLQTEKVILLMITNMIPRLKSNVKTLPNVRMVIWVDFERLCLW